ncbi:hypothetical protein PInf_013606 [Phytophthora infestans]|nr:hypothetical protein PInf_013606 [Phytophthora infestans]
MTEGSIVCRRMPDFLKSVLDSKEPIRLHRTIQSQVEGELQLQLRGRTTIRPSRQQTQMIQEDIRVAAEELHVNTPELGSMLSLAKTISYNHIEIYNITRFTDVGRLVAYLQQHIATKFEMDDMDTCTPDSRTSTVWKLTVQPAECPDFLRGIVRIMWYGRPLVLKHPFVGPRLQCLRCGMLGHTLARCRYTDQQLLQSGSRVATEQEVARLEDMAQPFRNLDEVKRAAAKRLALQAAAVQATQVSITPPRVSVQHPQTSPGAAEPGSTKQSGPAGPPAESIIPSDPKKKWITTPLRNGRKLYAHAAALQQKLSVTQSRFAALDDEEVEESVEVSPVSAEQAGNLTIVISSGDEQVEKAPVPLTYEQNQQLHLVKDKPPKPYSTPQLVGLKQRERKAVLQAVAKVAQRSGDRLTPLPFAGGELTSFAAIEESLALSPVSTPATGNCITMALAQAMADADLAVPDGTLDEITGCIKRGIQWAGQLHMSEQYDHYVRTNTLVNVDHGWAGMEAHESTKQFKWYLEEYANSPSNRDAIIPRYNWGCSELLAMAANFLQREIFVLAYDTDNKRQWYCSMYKPSTTKRGKQSFEVGLHIPLQLGRCTAMIRAAKLKGSGAPLVLRHWGEHYSAFIHQRRPVEQQPPPPPATPEDTSMEVDQQGEAACSSNEQGLTEKVWQPDHWNGDVAELRARLTGMTIPHELKCEIHLILERAKPARYAELLAFLVNTASQLSREERLHLRGLALASDNEPGVTELLQQYHLPLITLRQWQEESERAHTEEQDLHMSQASSSGVERIRLRVKSKARRDLDTATSEPMRDAGQGDVPHDTEGGIASWQAQWNQQATVWPGKALAVFPLTTSTAEVWAYTAQQEPSTLISMCQLFRYPEEVLMSVGEKVLESWSSSWRQECLLGSLVAYHYRSQDGSVKKWLDNWKDKLLRTPPLHLPPLIDNREDWAKMRAKRYGNDDVLQLCDVGNKGKLAQHLICAFLYERELRVLTGLEDEENTGALSLLTRQLLALEMNASYRKALSVSRRPIDWRAVHRFFSTALKGGTIGWEQDD